MDKTTAKHLASIIEVLLQHKELNALISKLLLEKLPELTSEQKNALIQLTKAEQETVQNVRTLLPALKASIEKSD